MKTKKHEFLTGVISPISWTQSGDVEKYSLYTEEDEDIILKGENLKETFTLFKNKRVRVGGRFLSSHDEARIFAVTDTKLLNKVA